MESKVTVEALKDAISGPVPPKSLEICFCNDLEFEQFVGVEQLLEGSIVCCFSDRLKLKIFNYSVLQFSIFQLKENVDK